MAKAGADFHLRQRIADVGVTQLIEPHGLRIIRLDGHERRAAAPIIGRKLFDPRLVHLRGRAMVTGENNHQNFARGKVFQTVSLVIYARQAKVRGLRADGQRRRLVLGSTSRNKTER